MCMYTYIYICRCFNDVISAVRIKAFETMMRTWNKKHEGIRVFAGRVYEISKHHVPTSSRFMCTWYVLSDLDKWMAIRYCTFYCVQSCILSLHDVLLPTSSDFISSRTTPHRAQWFCALVDFNKCWTGPAAPTSCQLEFLAILLFRCLASFYSTCPRKQQQICYFSQPLSQWFVEIWRVYILYPLVFTLEQELSSRSTKYVSLRHLRVSQGYAKASPAPRDPYRLGGGRIVQENFLERKNNSNWPTVDGWNPAPPGMYETL